MLTLETLNELTLKVTCTGNDVLYTKAGAFIAGDSPNGKNYRFEKVLLGPQSGLMQAAFGSLVRRVTGENFPLMKVTMNGDSVTYYANYGQHVIVYKLDYDEVVSVESENILAFTKDCDYNVRFIGCGVLSQKGLATTTLTGKGPEAYVAVLADGNPLVLSNVNSRIPSLWTRMLLSAGWDTDIVTRRLKRILTGRPSLDRPPVSPMLLSGAAVSR